jgi:hypothetical protein
MPALRILCYTCSLVTWMVICLTTAKFQSYFTTGGLPPISSSWCQAPWDSQPEFFFQLNTCGCSPYVTSSLTRGWICHLQLLLDLASSFILRSKSCRTHDHVLLSQIRDSSNLGPRSPYLFSSGTEWPSYIPQHWVPFLYLLRLAGIRWR